MTYVLTVAAPEKTSRLEQAVETIRDRLDGQGCPVEKTDWLSEGRACDIILQSELPDGIGEDLTEGFDTAFQPTANRRKKLLLADMDSTMIQLESLDSLAEELGFGEEVRDITDRGMRGELDFRASLRTRVALLKGQSTDAMAKILKNIPYTPGAEVAVKTMAAHGCYCALVSGGFTFTTEVVYRKLGFHEHRANRFEITGDKLTGRVLEPILGGDSKQHALEELMARLDVPVELTCTIGDGANDLDMLLAADMGVGYHGKPIVQEMAPFNIRRGDMTTLLYFQGYRDSEFITL